MTQAAQLLETTMFLREAQVLILLQVSRSTLFRWVKEGHFPEPILLSTRIKAWPTANVRAWVEAQDQPA